MKNILHAVRILDVRTILGIFTLLFIFHTIRVLIEVEHIKSSFLVSVIQYASDIEKAELDSDIYTLNNLFIKLKKHEITWISFESNFSKLINNGSLKIGEDKNSLFEIIIKNHPIIFRGAEIGKLSYGISLYDVGSLVLKKNITNYLFIIFLIFLVFIFSFYEGIKTIHRIENDLVILAEATSGNLSNLKMNTIFTEFTKRAPTLSGIGAVYNASLLKILSTLSRLVEIEHRVGITETKNLLAKQVAHDIRSPLTALNLVMSTAKELPEEKRILIRNAVQRINDIANHLIETTKLHPQAQKQIDTDDISLIRFHQTNNLNTSSSIPELSKIKTHLLSSLIDTIVSEKRIEYRNNIDVHIEADLSQSYGLFANVDSSDFQRVLSNLINNSVESLKNNNGEVKVSVRGYADKILVVVFDNGKGIPEHILNKLGTVGVSFGKDGTTSGSGLGIAHAKKIIENFNGNISIQSRLNQGTMITITLPRKQIPNWFVENISFNQYTLIVSVDDDVSIHQVWNERFNLLPTLEPVKHISFTSIKTFMDWFSTQRNKLDNSNENVSKILFLIDYEFLGETETGINLIESFNLSKQAILVTSHYEELQIREICDKNHIKLIPKSMTGIVPIVFEK